MHNSNTEQWRFPMSIYHEKYVELQRLRNAKPIGVTPSRTALLIIDMQEYFLNPDSPHSRSIASVAPDMADVNEYLYEQGRNVVVPALQRLVLFFRKGELVINKTSYSAFAGTGLEQKLHNMDVTTLVIGGLVTNFCVETTARDGVD